MGKIFDLRQNGKNGTVKNGYFVPFSSHFPHLCTIFLKHIPPQPSTTHVPCPLLPPPPQFPPISPDFPQFPPFFQTPKWFGELVRLVAVSADVHVRAHAHFVVFVCGPVCGGMGRCPAHPGVPVWSCRPCASGRTPHGAGALRKSPTPLRRRRCCSRSPWSVKGLRCVAVPCPCNRPLQVPPSCARALS